ncbi:hypothetical protein [Brevibacterium sp. Mu109]|nr:hypothetical protein [Brevibacterium sp. Mu109]
MFGDASGASSPEGGAGFTGVLPGELAGGLPGERAGELAGE